MSSFNGAVHRSARKGRRPPRWSAGPQSLQRSRAPECTERRWGCPRRMMERRCFNGAVHRSARKGATSTRSRAGTTSGFNGAVHRSARKVGMGHKHIIPLIVASTEPCTGVHGKATAWSRRASWCAARFNGAVHRSARKATQRRSLMSAPEGLQRSRAPECTESVKEMLA